MCNLLYESSQFWGQTCEHSNLTSLGPNLKSRKVHKFQPKLARLYEGSKKSGSKIAFEESSSDRRLRQKILCPIEETLNSDQRIVNLSLRTYSSLFVRSFIQTGWPKLPARGKLGSKNNEISPNTTRRIQKPPILSENI